MSLRGSALGVWRRRLLALLAVLLVLGVRQRWSRLLLVLLLAWLAGRAASLRHADDSIRSRTGAHRGGKTSSGWQALRS